MGKKLLIILFLGVFLTMTAAESFARVGRGSSSGFRSYKSQKYNQPSQSNSQQTINKSQSQLAQPGTRPSFFNSGIFRGLVGGMLIGGLLSFFMGHGFQFGSPGLLEILLIGGLLFFLYRRFVAAKQARNYQYASNAGAVQETGTYQGAETVTQSIAINEQFVKDISQSTYKALQEAWSKGDLSPVKNMATPRMFEYLNRQLDELSSQGLKNIVEIVYIGDTSIIDVEEENDNKVAIVRIDALLRDYTVDKNDMVVEGSKDTPVDAREYWAFTGKALDWKLDDIRQVSQ
jgi:predicted lipid-binding transport protein (Tim44 family)